MTRPAMVTLMVLTAWSASAEAQPRPQGELIVGGERLFGLSHVKETWTDDTNTEIEITSTSISLLTSALSASGGSGQLAPAAYSSPRVTIDYLPIDGLTVGGVLGLARVSVDITQGAGDSEELSASLVLFGPRAGYAFMFSPGLGIWGRGGFTYFSVGGESENGDSELSASGLSLDLDGLLLLMPAPNIAFTVGPSLNYGLSGSAEIDTVAGRAEYDVDTLQFGIQAGLSVML